MFSFLLQSPARECFIHRLQDDVLYEIFCLAASDPTDTESAHRGGAHAPETISLVCRHWRAVAEASPRLWSHIEVDSQHSIARTSRWLALCRQTPITVRCSWSIKNNTMEIGSQIQLLKIHTSSIETLRIVGDRAAQDAVSDLLTRLSASTSLRTLDLNGPKNQSVIVLQIEGDHILFPTLRKLLLRRLIVEWNWWIQGLTVLVLDNLYFSQPTWDQVSNILLSSPNLNELCLRNTELRHQEEFVEERTTSDGLNRPILLHHLERLEVWDIQMDALSLFFDIIHAPSLSELLVKSTSRLPDLVQTITSSASTLTHLRLGFISSTEPGLLRALQIPLPRLGTLGLFGPGFFSSASDSMFEVMIHYKGLKSLHISGMDVEAEQLVGMIRWREAVGDCQAIEEVVSYGNGPRYDVKSSLVKLGVEFHALDENGNEEWDAGEDWYGERQSSASIKVQVVLTICLLFSSVILTGRAAIRP
ncbi:hypothetical protein FRB94_008491 [Tulasnella sp. JGI-2019a]|nr:hypothetical protein FRB93_010843 [Tulasnella sp. JGI-2019a]KAG9011420.1 hypothetical protein FRB94_008491 [Tulasnella sp. JGI-2019a]